MPLSISLSPLIMRIPDAIDITISKTLTLCSSCCFPNINFKQTFIMGIPKPNIRITPVPINNPVSAPKALDKYVISKR